MDLDDAESRALARRLAERLVVLLRNDGILPLAAGQQIAVVGPRADEATAMLGCYSFPVHAGVNYPDLPAGIDLPTVLDALRGHEDGHHVSYAQGCPVLGGDDAGITAAADLDRAVDATGGEEEAAISLPAGKSLWTARVNARSRISPGDRLELAVDTQVSGKVGARPAVRLPNASGGVAVVVTHTELARHWRAVVRFAADDGHVRPGQGQGRRHVRDA